MRLEDVISAVLDVPVADLDEDTSQASLDKWDSLAHIQVVSAVEETFDVELSTTEMRRGTSVAALRDILAQKGVVA